MKKIIASIVPFLAALSTYAAEPVYGDQSLSLPAVVPAGVTTNLASPPVMDVRKQNNVAVQITISGAGAVTNSYALVGSVDGTTYETATRWTLSVVSTDGTATTVSTNLTALGLGYIKIKSITTLGAVTNNAAKYSVKINAD